MPAADLETIAASWTAPEDDGGQPVANYRYRFVIDDGDGQPDENDWSGTGANPAADRDLTSGTTDNANVSATIMVDTDMVMAGNQPLTEEMTYWFQVSAINEDPLAGERPADADAKWSTAVKFSTGEAAAPNAVEGLMSQQAIDATPGTERGVLLMWNKPSSGSEPTRYEVELRDDDGEWVLPRADANAVLDRTSYTDPDEPEADEVRLYRVRAVKDADEGEWTMVHYPRDPAAGHPHALPGTVGDASGLTATAPGTAADTAVLTWTEGDGCQHPLGAWYRRER